MHCQRPVLPRASNGQAIAVARGFESHPLRHSSAIEHCFHTAVLYGSTGEHDSLYSVLLKPRHWVIVLCTAHHLGSDREMKTPPELALRRRIDRRARSLVDQAADS